MDLKEEGVGPVEATPADKFSAPIQTVSVGTAASLTALSADFVFFTPALLFTHAGLDRDPVQEFVNSRDDAPEISVISFDEPIFQGLRFPDGRRDWDHKLLACPRPVWPDLSNFLGRIGLTDTPKRVFYRVFPQVVRVADPVFDHRASALAKDPPTVEVVAVCLDGNTRRVTLDHFKDPLRRPAVTLRAPDAMTKTAAKEIFAARNPYATPESP